jgi:hypothetical protein
MASKRKFGEPTSESLDDIWQRRGMGSAVAAVRKVISGGTIPPGTPIGRLDDIELGWLVAAGLFACSAPVPSKRPRKAPTQNWRCA